MDIQHIQTETAADYVYRQIRKHIFEKRLTIGQRLPEIAIAKEFAVSRTPVREALRKLENEGLVQIKPGWGACLASPTREEIMDTYVECLQQARERLKQLKNIKLIEAEHYDRSKIVLSVKNLKNTDGEVLNGKRFQEMLRSYHLEMEMASGSYVIAMTGPGDTQEGMDRLVQAVMEIDKNILCEELSGNDEDHTIKNISYEMVPLEQAYSSFEAGRMEGESVKWNEASGRISLEYVYLYPPGIPMIVPGERITSTIVQKMVKYKEMGFSIEGLSQENCLLVAGNPE